MVGPLSITEAGAFRDLSGHPKLMAIRHPIDATREVFEYDVYDLASGTAVGALRHRSSSGGTALPCHSWLLLSPMYGAVLTHTYPSGRMASAHGPIDTVLGAPSFQWLTGTPAAGAADIVQEIALSDSVLGFDYPLHGIAVRCRLGTAMCTSTDGRGGPPLLLDFVEGADVYAESIHGTVGFQQEYRVDPDGTPVLYRAKTDRHITAMRTDGTTLFWTESCGSTDVLAPPTCVEVWASPYTSDPVTLQTTAHKLASIPAGERIPQISIAFTGLYALISDGIVHVVRLADGKVLEVTAGAGFGFYRVVLVTPTELWGVVSETGGSSAVALRRFALGTW